MSDAYYNWGKKAQSYGRGFTTQDSSTLSFMLTSDFCSKDSEFESLLQDELSESSLSFATLAESKN